jgi:hypothetical protein
VNHAARLAREDAITEALRAINDALGDAEPTAQAFAIIDAIKRLRDGQPVRVTSTDRRDYMAEAQARARAEWQRSQPATSPTHDATAGIDTPLGRLRVTTWRRLWRGEKGERVAWASEYYLNDLPITVAEIRACGLAQRPTSRNRKRS